MLLSHSGYIKDAWTCEILSKAGFSAIDMDDTTDPALFEGSLEDSCNAVRTLMQKAEDAGLLIRQCHAVMPFYTIDKTEQEIEDTICSIERCVRVTSALKIPYTVVHPFVYAWNAPDPTKDAYLWDLNTTYLKRICANANDTVLCLENLPRAGGFLKNGAQMATMLEKVGDDRLMVCLDTGHLFSNGEPASAFFAAVGDRIRVTHIHDTTPNADHHLPLYMGRMDIQNLKQAIIDYGYTGDLDSESSFLRKLPPHLRTEGAILERQLLETLVP